MARNHYINNLRRIFSCIHAGAVQAQQVFAPKLSPPRGCQNIRQMLRVVLPLTEPRKPPGGFRGSVRGRTTRKTKMIPQKYFPVFAQVRNTGLVCLRTKITLRLLNALNSEDRGWKVRFSLATIAFDRESAQMSQILSSQGKNAPSNPYPHYLVRLATSRQSVPQDLFPACLGFVAKFGPRAICLC